MRAAILVQRRPPYYGHVMGDALRAMGYAVQFEPLRNPRLGDVLVTWNRHETRDAPVKAHERAGGTVLVVENGYFGRNFAGAEWFAIAKGQHNGAGEWPPGDPERWKKLGVDLKPWKTDGREIVLLATRNMGSALCREPPHWSASIAKRMAAITRRPARIRAHPGPQGAVPPVSLEDDLRDAWAAVTWGSSAGLKALALGVPVFCGFPKWIGRDAAAPIGGERFIGDRLPMFHRVASAMWSIDEIARGVPFRWLLR